MDIVSSSSQLRSHALECVVEGAPLIVPSSLVRQLISVTLDARLPFAQPWLTGLGLFEAGVVLVAWLGAAPHAEGALVPCILLALGDGTLPCVLRVDRVGSLVDVASVEPTRAPGAPSWPSWVGSASTAGGERVAHVNAGALAVALAGRAAT